MDSGKPFVFPGNRLSRQSVSAQETVAQTLHPSFFNGFQRFRMRIDNFPGVVPNAWARNRNHLPPIYAGFALFSNGFDEFRETICLSGKPFA